jgi:hypothetical protein
MPVGMRKCCLVAANQLDLRVKNGLPVHLDFLHCQGHEPTGPGVKEALRAYISVSCIHSK